MFSLEREIMKFKILKARNPEEAHDEIEHFIY